MLVGCHDHVDEFTMGVGKAMQAEGFQVQIGAGSQVDSKGAFASAAHDSSENVGRDNNLQAGLNV